MQKHRCSAMILAALLTFACASPAPEGPPTGQNPAENLDQGLDAVSNFLAGALTISQGLSQELPEFEENFRKNREWFVQFFLPHLEKTEAHDPWICKDYCVEAVKKSVDGNQQYQQKIEDHTSKKPS